MSFLSPRNVPLRATRAVVDLDAITHNLDLLAAQVPGTGLVPAVKADGYGHGMVPVATACAEWGAAMLAVATVEETLILRDAGISIPILILEELFPDEVDAALTAGATLSVGSVAYADIVSRTAQARAATAAVHVNIDTGMGRMGLLSTNARADVARIAALPGIAIEGIYSHFTGSDEDDLSPARSQHTELDRLYRELSEAGYAIRYRHIANSGALLQLPAETGWELARPGVAVYGMEASATVGRAHPVGRLLKPALRLESRIVKLTRHTGPWTIGYGRTHRVGAGDVIGIVPIGYGDGYPRILSGRAEALVAGQRVPVAGRVSMDMIALDLTTCASRVALGDEVVLIGRQGEDEITARELAEHADTISYEITCGLTARVPRVYTRSGAIVATNSPRNGYQAVTGRA